MSGAPARWRRAAAGPLRFKGQSVRSRAAHASAIVCPGACRASVVWCPRPPGALCCARVAPLARRSLPCSQPAHPSAPEGAPRRQSPPPSFPWPPRREQLRKDAACIVRAHRPNSRLRKIASLLGEPSSFPVRNPLTRLRKTPFTSTKGRRAAHSTRKQTSTTTTSGITIQTPDGMCRVIRLDCAGA